MMFVLNLTNRETDLEKLTSMKDIKFRHLRFKIFFGNNSSENLRPRY